MCGSSPTSTASQARAVSAAPPPSESDDSTKIGIGFIAYEKLLGLGLGSVSTLGRLWLRFRLACFRCRSTVAAFVITLFLYVASAFLVCHAHFDWF